LDSSRDLKLNEPAEQAAEFSPGCSDRSERNPGYVGKMNNQARFRGRQTLTAATTVVSPAKAGFGLLLIWLSAICVLLVFFSGCNRPGTSGGSPATSGSSPRPVSSSLDVVKIKADSVAIAVGGNADATVVLAISPGFHVNANPATFPYLIATELEVGNGFDMITAGKPLYPAAQRRRFKFAEQPLAVYEDEVKLTLPLRATSKATKGPVSLPISVTVQACDEEKCYPPGRLNAMIPVEVK
jgi:hypothetical protein